MLKPIKIIFLALITFLSACLEATAGNSITEPSNKHNFDKFINSITSFPYNAPIKQQEHLISNYQKLKIGMTKSEVVNILSSPSAEFFTYTEAGEKNIFKRSSWAYYLSRQEHNLATDNDAVLFLHFNELEQLHWAIPDNIESLTPLGKPVGAR